MATATRGRLLQALPVSVAVHGALLLLAVGVAVESGGTGGDASPELTVVELSELEDLTGVTASDDDEGGAPVGATQDGDRAGPTPRPRPARARATRHDSEVPPAPSGHDQDGEPVLPPAARVGDVVGDLSGALEGAAAGGGLSVGGGGLGGRGGGTGTAHGDGHGIGAQPPPAGKPPSKARPAVLIHPKRTRRIDPERLFVIRVTVDKKGYVAGARLVSGIDPHLDKKALDAIWRFRYRPALDDDGRPTRSQLDQSFMLRW